MTLAPYTLIPEDDLPPALGLIVLQPDETLEPEFKGAFADTAADLYVTRIASAPEVTPETLRAMEGQITAAARLLPNSRPYRVIGYGCTSASAVIGAEAVADLVRQAVAVAVVTNPLSAAIAYARHLGITRLGLLSPYIASVNAPLRAGFAQAGIETPAFATFGESIEARVARINAASIIDSASRLGRDPHVEGVFLSCTNLKTQAALSVIAKAIGKPVFSSNSALAWHMKSCAGV